jgi:hypothetical protein
VHEFHVHVTVAPGVADNDAGVNALLVTETDVEAVLVGAGLLLAVFGAVVDEPPPPPHPRRKIADTTNVVLREQSFRMTHPLMDGWDAKFSSRCIAPRKNHSGSQNKSKKTCRNE